MKYPKVKIILAFLLLCHLFTAAQIPERNVDEELFCRNNDYQFSVEGRIYLDRKKVYVCPKNFPVEIILVDTANQNVLPSTFTWEIDGILSTQTNDTLSLELSDFSSDKAEVICTFMDATNGSVDLELKVFKNQSLSFHESTGKYAFDDNKIDTFRTAYGGTEVLGTPWVFLEMGRRDTLEARAKKKKGFYAINHIESSDPVVIVDPDFLSIKKEDIAIDHTIPSNGTSIMEIDGCDTIPELLIFADNFKTFEIEFIRVCETDDDIQVVSVGDTVSSPYDICIHGGMDKVVDLMKDSNFLTADDAFWFDGTGIQYVIAGPNLICETTAHPNNPPVCPDNFNVDSLVATANNILGKVGVEIINVADTQMINYNYDVLVDDGILNGDEQRTMHNLMHGANSTPSSDITQIYLIADLGTGSTGMGIVQGRAMTNLNTLCLDVLDAVRYTLVHEFGHAKWGLIHPGGPSTISLKNEFGRDDEYNFMNGISNDVKQWNIRRYQFSKIH